MLTLRVLLRSGIQSTATPPATKADLHARQVTAPAGTRPGDTLNVQGPNGQQLQVVIPAGVAAGQPFMVQLPVAPPVVVAGTVVGVAA